MSLKATIQAILKLKEKLDGLRPLKVEDENRLWKKFRLEWNYNSNHIEGNTLTYGETELLLIFGKTTGDHTLREYEEMKAHDIAVNWLREQAAEADDRFNEGFIRELNSIILKEPFFKAAETPDGKETQKQIVPGEYKSSPNSVRLATGEMFHYASPEETPAKMGDLAQWYRKVMEAKEMHPVQIAAELHYKFVLIHPFDDGNGRVARLLMNYVLMRAGYPPIIIPTKDKKAYLDALNKVDTKVDTEAFATYVAKQLVWSLELNIKAAKGEDIEEDDDLDKEIEVFGKSVTVEPAVKVSNEVIKGIYLAHLKAFIDDFLDSHKNKFSSLLSDIRFSIAVNNGSVKDRITFERIMLNYNEYYDRKSKLSKQKPTMWARSAGVKIPLSRHVTFVDIGVVFVLRSKDNSFEQTYSSLLNFHFGMYSYKLKYAGRTNEFSYPEFFSKVEAKNEIKKILKESLEELKKMHRKLSLDS